MPTLTTRAFKRLMWVTRYRERTRPVDQHISVMHRRAIRPRHYRPFRLLDLVCGVTAEHRGGMVVYRVRPRSDQPERHLLFFHGGGFNHEIGPNQWLFVALLARALSAEVLVPIYPMAPVGRAEDTFSGLVDLWAQESQAGRTPDVVGDSSGGGMALALLLQVGAAGLPLPARCALLTPWLDLTVRDPQVWALADRDVMLSPRMLTAASRVWAADLPLDDQRVSPLFGDLRSLRATRFLCQTGTDDVVNVDARKFRDAAADAGLTLTYVEEEQLPHEYPIMPIPEARRALRQVVDFLR